MSLAVFFKGLCWCGAALFVSVSAEELTGVVISVHDGDTITLQAEASTKNIRLAGIDAPEIKQPYGIESRDALRQDVLSQQC